MVKGNKIVKIAIFNYVESELIQLLADTTSYNDIQDIVDDYCIDHCINYTEVDWFVFHNIKLDTYKI